MKFRTHLAALAAVALAAPSLTSCDMMTEDIDDCPTGLYVKFKYDYNLQRADMFNDHVGAVTLYIFDEQGKLVKTQQESGTPLKDANYLMNVRDLAEGDYKFIALAGQTDYASQLATSRAHFVRTEPLAGGDWTGLEVTLDHESTRSTTDYEVVNNALPLDTLWHGIRAEAIHVKNATAHADTVEISLVRDTKQIAVSLYELDDPTEMDVDNYDFRIYDRNTHILYDNSLDETDEVTYTPYATWNTQNSEPEDGGGYGVMAHTGFMTSRILAHSSTADDAVLSITSRETGEEVVRIDLATTLARLRNAGDRTYESQEFLDRGYDYNMTFYLKGGKLTEAYISMDINALSWAVRIQYESLD